MRALQKQRGKERNKGRILSSATLEPLSRSVCVATNSLWSVQIRPCGSEEALRPLQRDRHFKGQGQILGGFGEEDWIGEQSGEVRLLRSTNFVTVCMHSTLFASCLYKPGTTESSSTRLPSMHEHASFISSHSYERKQCASFSPHSERAQAALHLYNQFTFMTSASSASSLQSVHIT